MLSEFGGTNVLADAGERYPTVTVEDLDRADPDVVLLSSEPYPFRAEHADELEAYFNQ